MPAPSSVDRPANYSPSPRQGSVFGPVLSSLGWPVVIGLAAFWGFLLALDQGWIDSPLLVRYLSAHPVSYFATGMFFVGLASLALKLFQVVSQIIDRPHVKLSPAPALAQRPEESRHLLQELDQLSPGRQDSYLGQRLRNALEFVDKTESANGLEDELKYLADIDAEKQQESFALTRILIWAIPMLGFLGTVIGISGALGGLSVESDFNTMLTGLKEKLYVAFDTTALALTLSIVLMFAQFMVNLVETQWLAAVDEAANEALSGRFVTYGSNRDPYLASVEGMSQRVLDCMADVGAQQAEIWDRGLTAIQKTTDASLGKFAETLADRLAKQLDPVMDEFGVALRTAIQDSTSYLERHTSRLAEAMNHSGELVDQRNRQMVGHLEEQAAAVKQVVDAQTAGLKQCLSHSEEVLGQHLQQVQQLMNQTLDVASDQSRHFSLAIQNSEAYLQTHTESMQQAIQAARATMQEHAKDLRQWVASASETMEDHSRQIRDAVTQGEEIVNRRQETIARTQDSMLKAQAQQSLAISSFTEKLDTLQTVIEQSQAVEKLQTTLQETLSNLERSDTIAREIHGLARLVREQVKSIDQMQYAQAEATASQWAAVIDQIQELLEQNAGTLATYQQKMDSLVDTLVQTRTLAVDAAEPDGSASTDHYQSLMLQLVNQNQSLAMLSEQLKSSLNFEEISHQLSDVASQLKVHLDHDSRQAEQWEQQLIAVVDQLAGLRKVLEEPTAHQQQFLAQQKQTIEQQHHLLDFCRSLEVDQRSLFMETANQILDGQSRSANQSQRLESTVRSVVDSLSQLNQSLAAQADQAAGSALHFGKPETPKRVA